MPNEQETSAQLRKQLAALDVKRLHIEANENLLERSQQEDLVLEEQDILEALLAEALNSEEQ